VLFALSHGGFSRRHLTWTVFALVAGVLFGVMVEYYQSLSPAIVAHVTVNAINMRRLERYAKRPLPGRP
jgi:membrane protease YdiL (CAAX protease family)